MALPSLLSWVKQRIQLSTEKSGKIRPFGPVTFGTCPTEEVRIITAAVLTGKNVFEVEDQKIAVILV
jgi:hypothetical protein